MIIKGPFGKTIKNGRVSGEVKGLYAMQNLLTGIFDNCRATHIDKQGPSTKKGWHR
jgi:hypothetical protein